MAQLIQGLPQREVSEMRDERGGNITYKSFLGIFPLHQTPHVRVNGKHQDLDEDAPIERHVVEVDRLRLVVDDGLPRDGII